MTESNVVRVVGYISRGLMCQLIDYAGNEDEIALFDNCVKFTEEPVFPFLAASQETELPGLHPDFTFVQNHDIMAEISELQMLD